MKEILDICSEARIESLALAAPLRTTAHWNGGFKDDAKEADMLLIIGTVRLPAAGLEAAKASMSAMIAQSRLEDGCIDYVYAEDVLEKGLIHVKEIWRDRAALDHHFQSSHLAQWRSSWERLGVFDRRLALYEVGDPQAI